MGADKPGCELEAGPCLPRDYPTILGPFRLVRPAPPPPESPDNTIRSRVRFLYEGSTSKVKDGPLSGQT